MMQQESAIGPLMLPVPRQPSVNPTEQSSLRIFTGCVTSATWQAHTVQL